MLNTCCRDGQFTGQLAFAVDAQRVGRVVFGVRRRFAAIEHIVGGVVDQWNAQRRRLFSKHARGDGIDRERQLRLAFSKIHGSVCGGIDDQVRLVRPYLSTDLLGLAQIQLVTAQHNQLAQTGKALLQLNRHLAGFPANKNFQGNCSVSHATKSLGSVLPRRSP